MRKVGWPYSLEPYPYALTGGWDYDPDGKSLIAKLEATLVKLCRVLWRAVKTRFIYEQYTGELFELDDRMLKDIGLERFDIHRVAMEGAVKATR